MTPSEASALAKDFICQRYADAHLPVPVATLPGSVYGFEPEGWVLFEVVERNPTRLGASEYVAVSLSTGEVRSLGYHGE